MKGLTSLLIAVSFTLAAVQPAHADTHTRSLLERWSDDQLRDERIRRVQMKADYQRSMTRNLLWGTLGMIGGSAMTVVGAVVTAGGVTSPAGLPVVTLGLLTLAESKSALSRAARAGDNAVIVDEVILEIDSLLGMRSSRSGAAMPRFEDTRPPAAASRSYGGAAGAGSAR